MFKSSKTKKARKSFQRNLQPEALEDRRLLTFVPPGLTPGDTYHLIFACSQQTTNNLGNSAAYDSFVTGNSCGNAPGALTAGANYEAIVSDGNNRDANALLPSLTPNTPIYNTAGQLVATDYANMWLGPGTSLHNPVGYDEFGSPLVDWAEVWTGTDGFGFHNQSAGNWTGSGQATIGIAAGPGATTSQWTDMTSVNVGGASFWLYGISNEIIVPTPSGGCDLNNDGACDAVDINALVTAIHDGVNDPIYDLDGDGDVGPGDGDLWLELAGEENLGAGRFYKHGDGNLDGTVDGSDFLLWNAHKFTPTPLWTQGDWNYDGVVDGSDFLLWNVWKFSSSDQVGTNDGFNSTDQTDDDEQPTARHQLVDQLFAMNG